MTTSDVRPTSVQPHRPRGRSRTAIALQLGGLALAFILVSVLVVTSSRAAFVAQSDNPGNSVSSATVQLTDNDNGVAMFNVPALIPGQTIDRCISVTYTGTVDPLAVKLFVSGAPTGTLGTYLNLTIDYAASTGTAYSSCTGFSVTPTSVYNGTLAGFASTHPNYASGATTWDPGLGPETRTFRFRISVQDNVAAANLTTTFGFTWETRTS